MRASPWFSEREAPRELRARDASRRNCSFLQKSPAGAAGFFHRPSRSGFAKWQNNVLHIPLWVRYHVRPVFRTRPTNCSLYHGDRFFGVALDFASLGWHFGRLRERYTFEEIGEEDVSACCGLPELSPDQEQCLESFLENSISKAIASYLGVTSLTEHKIGIGNALIKHRYLISPRVQEVIQGSGIRC